MRRRRMLLGLISSASLPGCIGFGSRSATPLAIENNHTAEHTVTATFFRGSEYDTKEASATVAPDQRREFRSFVPPSDWAYPFVLDVKLDGEHALTSQHRWNESPVTITVGSDGEAEIDNRFYGTPTRALRQWRNESSVD